MEALKVLAGGVIGLGTLTIRWVYAGWETKALRAARLHGLSMFRVAPPCQRWGRVTRCDIWTVLGAFYGGVFGFGLGWVLLDSVPVGVVISVALAALFGWRYRVVTSILAVADAASKAGRGR
jgi:divalent metal cation (Fe/Co/Zn/Cd) transporter